MPGAVSTDEPKQRKQQDNNLVRNGDIARIEYMTEDFNISSSNLNYQKIYSTYKMPEYSNLMATGTVTYPVIELGTVTGATSEIKDIKVFAGDNNGSSATYINGNSATPALIIGSSVTDDVPIIVYAKDAAGNETEVSKTVTVDNTAPDAPTISLHLS